MSQETIRDFWNLPGVLGVALIHGQAEPYFYVKERIAEWEKQALKQSILETTARIPEKFEFFEFQVMGYHAYTYKLSSSLTLLVLSPNDIPTIKLLAGSQLKAVLRDNIGSAITAFEFYTKRIPQSKPASVAKPKGLESLSNNSTSTSSKEVVTIEELLRALNCLSRFSSNYMGNKLTVNYWQATRPNFDWLDKFQISRSAEILFSGSVTEPVNDLQHKSLKEWAAAFIKQCSQIVQDLPSMIEHKGLDERNRKLLLTSTSKKMPGGTAV